MPALAPSPRTVRHAKLRSRDVKDKDNPSTPMTVTLDYDLNGNLIDDGEKYEHTYDPFGRLTQIKNRGTSDVQAVYTYNGLGHRGSEQLDTDELGGSGKPDGVVDSNDPDFFVVRDDCGRRLAVYRGTDAMAKEVFYFHGKAKGACRGGPIMRERNQDLIDDPTTWATDPGDWEGHRDFFCTDFAGNIVALMGDEGLIEQYRYSASGVPLGIPLGDLNGDGFVDAANTDGDICKAAYTPYEVRADLNLDGVVDNDDLAIVTSADGNTTGRGKFSVASVRNIIGYGGGELFGEGLHAQWNFGGLTLDAGLSSGLTDPSRGGTTSFTIATGSTWNGNCRTDCGVSGCFSSCSSSVSVTGGSTGKDDPETDARYRCGMWCSDQAARRGAFCRSARDQCHQFSNQENDRLCDGIYDKCIKLTQKCLSNCMATCYGIIYLPYPELVDKCNGDEIIPSLTPGEDLLIPGNVLPQHRVARCLAAALNEYQKQQVDARNWHAWCLERRNVPGNPADCTAEYERYLREAAAAYSENQRRCLDGEPPTTRPNPLPRLPRKPGAPPEG